jgi:hypothetical protein
MGHFLKQKPEYAKKTNAPGQNPFTFRVQILKLIGIPTPSSSKLSAAKLALTG